MEESLPQRRPSPANQRHSQQFHGQSQTPPMTTSSYSPNSFGGGSPAQLVESSYMFPGANAFHNGNSSMASYQPAYANSNFVQQDPENMKRNSMTQIPSPLNFQTPDHVLQSFNDPFGGQPGNINPGNHFNGNEFLLDPALQAMSMPPEQRSVNPAAIMNHSSLTEDQISPTSNMMPMDALHGQPSLMQQGSFISSPGHSRHTSLDPSAAGVGQGIASEWSGMTGHRRSPSEYSDLSSVTHSPFTEQGETFDTYDGNHSPLLNPTQDGLYQEAMGIGNFSISDSQHRRGTSLGHSPYVSPHMLPTQGPGQIQEPQFLLPSNASSQQFMSGGPGPQIYNNSGIQDFMPNDMGQADMMSPPEINVEFAPPSRQPTINNGRQGDVGALSPPGSRGRRGRALSETSIRTISRPLPPGEISPALLSQDLNHRPRSLSPFDASYTGSSRDVSPASKSRRSSTSVINPNRDYILELADPNRPSGAAAGTRVQKHPATFQCTLCPKRFTRAYNLRSHLRTHTDERPFVCTVCGKAFARQHDRKRHEGLHSGEKKFVCKGELSNGGAWGCGRRFARADALGRHFRSEAGRVCIKPLLDEEAAERQRVFEDQMRMHQHGQMVPQMPNALGLDMNGGFALPQALLVQYPALQGIQWDQLGQGPDAGEGYYDEEDGYLSANGLGVQDGRYSDYEGI